jgi:copper chaperone
LTLEIGGMSCGHCVAAVKKALEGVPGVGKVEVTLDPPRAGVEYDPARATVEALGKAVEAEGYRAAPASGK